MIRVVISGGQTGVDRAALDAARSLGVLTAGWCPRGRRSRAGKIPLDYPLTETDSEMYPARTEANIRSSDATLILTRSGVDSRGVRFTIKEARKKGRPYLVQDINDQDPDALAAVTNWLRYTGDGPIHVLNVAGPSEKFAPGIQAQATVILAAIFRRTCAHFP